MRSGLVLGAAVALVGVLASGAQATPGSGVSGTILAQGDAVGRLDVHAVPGAQVVVRQITIQPGGSTGWHYHDGRLVAVVVSGTLTHYDRHCVPTVYRQGQAFLETDGRRHVHLGANRGAVPVVLMVTYIDPPGAPLSEDAAAPACDSGARARDRAPGGGVSGR
jgi:quercetin dioxygenase-like cupin family protein